MPRNFESFDKDLALLITTDGTATNDAVIAVDDANTEA